MLNEKLDVTPPQRDRSSSFGIRHSSFDIRHSVYLFLTLPLTLNTPTPPSTKATPSHCADDRRSPKIRNAHSAVSIGCPSSITEVSSAGRRGNAVAMNSHPTACG